jgi:hypothetical protein
MRRFPLTSRKWVESPDPPKEALMQKTQKQDRQKAMPIPEKALRYVTGRDDAYQHVDNPGQTPMKDDHP